MVTASAFCCAVLGAPTGKRLVRVMAELAPRLRRFEGLTVSDEVAAALVAMSPATMDRRLASDRAKMTLQGRSHTKPAVRLARRPRRRITSYAARPWTWTYDASTERPIQQPALARHHRRHSCRHGCRVVFRTSATFWAFLA